MYTQTDRQRETDGRDSLVEWEERDGWAANQLTSYLNELLNVESLALIRRSLSEHTNTHPGTSHSLRLSINDSCFPQRFFLHCQSRSQVSQSVSHSTPLPVVNGLLYNTRLDWAWFYVCANTI